MGPRPQTLPLNQPQSLGQPAGKARGALGTMGGREGLHGAFWRAAMDARPGGVNVGGHGHAVPPPPSCWASGTPRTAARSCGACCAPTARPCAPAAT